MAKSKLLWLATSGVFVLLYLPVMQAAEPIELIYFGNNDDAALLGLGQGLEDSSKESGKTVPTYNLRVVGNQHIQPYRDPAPDAIFAAADAESLRLLAQLNPEVPIFNLAESSTDLRAQCVANLLHVIPSEQMRADAISAGAELPKSVEATAWAPQWSRDGGAELNSRFKQLRKVGMSEQAWAGWVSGRMLAYAIRETGRGMLADVLEYLRTVSRVDAGKGAGVSFRENGQLRQPMLLVAGGNVIARVPGGESVTNESLDLLGFSECP